MEIQSLANVAFGFYSLIILGGGLLAVTSTSLVRALAGLVLTLFGVAGCYLLLAAPIMALMQIFIYVAAVSIIIFFAIMLTRAPAGGEEQFRRSPRYLAYVLVAAVAPSLMLARLLRTAGIESFSMPTEIPLEQLGQTFIEPYFLAFELISVVLTVAMVGAVLLGFERRQSR
jgi:NADH-quinone oxidoreductase subunit J